MSLTENGGLSAADIAAVTGGNGFGGFGNDGGALFWLLVLFLFGFGNNGWGNGAYGGNIGSEMYPWMNQSQQINDGFRDQMLNSSIAGIQQAITSGFGDVALGFANLGQNVMQQGYSGQIATMQGFNGLQSQLAQCCCDNRLASCQTQNLVQNEGNATRFADANNTRDIIDNMNRNNQAVMDKLCQLELDGVKNQLSQAERENTALQNQINMANMQIGFNNETDALYNRLKNCPVPSMPVYGTTPIFTCNQNGGCGCGNNGFMN